MGKTNLPPEVPDIPLESNGTQMESNGTPVELTKLPLESNGTPLESNKVPVEKRDRVAVCLTCSNEWVAHNGNNKKPSRCPSCKSREVSWRDELKSSSKKKHEITYAINSQDAGTPIFQMEQSVPQDFPKETGIMESTSSTLEPDGNSNVETSLEKIKAGFPTLPIKTIVLILGGICALGLILFLARKHKENREARLREMQQHQEQQEQRRSGTAAAILRQKGIIGGY